MPWSPPTPSEKRSSACGGGGYYWCGGVFCFSSSSFVGRRGRSEEEAVKAAKEEMGKSGDLWDDSALVGALDQAVATYKAMHGKNNQASPSEKQGSEDVVAVAEELVCIEVSNEFEYSGDEIDCSSTPYHLIKKMSLEKNVRLELEREVLHTLGMSSTEWA